MCVLRNSKYKRRHYGNEIFKQEILQTTEAILLVKFDKLQAININKFSRIRSLIANINDTSFPFSRIIINCENRKVLTYKSQRISSPVLILDKLLLHKEAWSMIVYCFKTSFTY